MALKKCKECGKEISSNAKVCPNCGKPQRMGCLTACGILILVFIGLGILISILEKPSEQQKQSEITSIPSPPQKSDAELINEIENKIKEYQNHLKEYYPTTEMSATLNGYFLNLLDLEQKYSKPKNEDERKILKKIKKIQYEIGLMRRKVFAEVLEKATLKEGLDVSINATGKNKKILNYKYALMSKAMAFNITNTKGFFDNAKMYGFKKIIFTDGYSGSWSYDLTKE